MLSTEVGSDSNRLAVPSGILHIEPMRRFGHRTSDVTNAQRKIHPVCVTSNGGTSMQMNLTHEPLLGRLWGVQI